MVTAIEGPSTTPPVPESRKRGTGATGDRHKRTGPSRSGCGAVRPQSAISNRNHTRPLREPAPGRPWVLPRLGNRPGCPWFYPQPVMDEASLRGRWFPLNHYQRSAAFSK